MLSVNTHEAKTNLSALLQLVETKNTLVRICRDGKPIAELIPISSSKSKLKKENPRLKVKFHEDPILPLKSKDLKGLI